MNLLPILFGEKWRVQPKAPSTPPETLIHRLCRQSGNWTVTNFDSCDVFLVRTTKATARVIDIVVRSQSNPAGATPLPLRLTDPISARRSAFRAVRQANAPGHGFALVLLEAVHR